MKKFGPIAAAFVAGALVAAVALVEVVPPSATQLVAAPDGSTPAGDVVVDGASPVAGTPGTKPSTTGGAAGTAGTAGTAATTTTSAGTGAGTSSSDSSGGSTPGSSPSGGGGGSGDGGGQGGGGLACAPGRNGGSTDQGVTADKVVLATTVVESGTGSSFLGEVRYAMDAVKNRVNREGGICGRLLEIEYRDDGWDAGLGSQFLRNFINQGIFAVPVGPSSEGLNAVIDSGDFDRAGIPVVGTDGLIEKQYQRKDGSAQPWVWPVAAATVSSARIMAVDAYNRMRAAGIKPKNTDFSVVFDSNYKFGQEGAEAFNQQVRLLTKADIDGYSPGATGCSKSFCGVPAGQSSYSGQVANFVEGKFVALFLEPDTALKWMNDQNAPRADEIAFGIGAAQPLFTRNFAETCKTKCDTMIAWTGFKPFVEQYRSDPAVQRYVSDLKATCPGCDEANQFSQGAYIGMELLVEALRKVGPRLRRADLKNVLDHMSYRCGLCLRSPLSYTPSNRYAATTMQGWQIQYKGTFGGWRAGGVVRDPKFGR